jgi:hypothetical protein
MDKFILSKYKNLVRENNLIELKNLTDILLNSDLEYRLNFEHIYNQVLLTACINVRKEILEWLLELYQNFDEVTKIALRPSFIYGKYLIKNSKSTLEWYKSDFLPTVLNNKII